MKIKMIHCKKLFLCICLLFPLALVECYPVTALPSPPVPTPSQTQTILAEPSLVFETNTPTLTPTPKPTLLPEQAEEIFLNLLETNGGCMLPCWWGIIPGETRAQDVVSFFEPFASEISIGDTGIAVYFSTPPDEISDHPIAHSFQISAGIVTHMRIDRMEGAESFRLPLVLADYGQPDGVWIRTFNPNPYTQTSFSVITFYGRRGIVAYWQGSGDVIGDTIHGCIETGPSLRLWAPDPSIATIEDTSKLFDPILPGGELTLMQATGMDVEMFYERFKGIDDPVCIDTPTNLWYGWYDATPIATPSR